MMKVGLAAQTGEAGPGGTQEVPPQPKPPPTLAEVAQLFPQLEILECLGCGGMGAVYKARQPRLDRFVALKILTRDREDTTRHARFVERFEREARALAKLSHPNIVAMYEFGQVEGLPYFIMEYVDGLNVRQLEQARKLAPREALEIIPQICAALQFAHDEGIVHRDIKPANILLDRKGRVKIADFGIAKIMGGTPLIASDAEKLAAKPGEGLTQDQVLGTPDYMAPEQVKHPQTVDHRADIYSLGVVFYEMLTGELPLGRFQPPSRKVQIDVRLDEIVLHTLEKEPERRYQHASEVKTDLEAFGSTAAPVRSSAGDRSLRIPGTNLALVESRNGQRLVNWTNVSLAWVLLMLVGAAGLGLVEVIANQMGFYFKPETFPTAGVVMAFVATVVLTVAVQQALRLPAAEFESLAPSAKASSETLDLERVKSARRLVRWPATGLSAIGLSYFVAAGCFFGFAHWPANWQDALGVCGVLAIIVINYVIILGASRMRQLRDYRMAVLAAIVCLVFSLPGLPLAAFPIWALMVLYRPDVRAAFKDMARKGASEPAAPPASASSVSVPRAGVAWKIVAVVAAVALLLIAVAVGSKLLAVYGHSQARQQQVSAGAVVRTQEKLCAEIQRRLNEGGWKADISVTVSPDLEHAECHLAEFYKEGVRRGAPVPAAIHLEAQGQGIWQVRGEGAFQWLRFSVDTKEGLAAPRDTSRH
jgi:tRNA A-37 threonylcarbamoyl transferase component Bud32